eukprot:11140654-Karenia_brevis.AAC.1
MSSKGARTKCKLCKTENPLHEFPIVNKSRHRSIVCEECRHPFCEACGAKIMEPPNARAMDNANIARPVVDGG